MSHAGPNNSGTTDLYEVSPPTHDLDRPAKTGSDEYAKKLITKEFQEKILTIIHGH